MAKYQKQDEEQHIDKSKNNIRKIIHRTFDKQHELIHRI